MKIPFKNTNFLPQDRSYTNNDGRINFNFLNLGACSYIGDCNINCYDNAKPIPNILIGRFCSLAGDILFFLGYNHNYRNVVTTYPFDNFGVVRSICVATNINRLNYYPSENRYDNHYQIIIGNDVWIGDKTTILGGVKIGTGAIIGKDSFVAKDIPPYAIAVGNPARVIKYRFDTETIRKLLALKWWNWDIKKILDSVPIMGDIERFLYENYSKNEVTTPNPMGGGIEIAKFRSEGRKIYSFIADFRAVHPLWQRVVSGFLKSDPKNSVLVLFLGESSTDKDLENLKNLANSIDVLDGKTIHVIPPTTNEIYSSEILRNSTHFITTREFINIECLDLLCDTNVKVLSALDDAIFENEPAVNWTEIYK